MAEATATKATAARQVSMRRDGPLRVLHLAGSYEDMARQHGELLADEVRAGIVPRFRDFLPAYVRAGLFRNPRLRARLARLIEKTIVQPFARQMSSSLLAEADALATAAGVDPDAVRAGLGVPDAAVMLYLVELAVRGWTSPPRLGCTGISAGGAATVDGHLLHARNFDYDTIGLWYRYPVVAFCRPDKGLRYAYVATAGVHTCAFHSVNEAGVFAAVNTLPTRDLTLRAQPFFGIVEELIRTSRSFEEAVDIAARTPFVGGYTIHVAHGPSGRSAFVERGARRAAVRLRSADGTIAAANHAVTPELQAVQPRRHFADRWHSGARLSRAQTLLDSLAGQLDPAKMAAIIGDQVDPGVGLERPMGQVLGNHLTAQSVVLDLTAMQLWVSTGAPPSSRTEHIGFDILEELGSDGGRPASRPAPIPAASDLDGPRGVAVRRFTEALTAYRHEFDTERALSMIQHCALEDPAEPAYELVAGQLALVADRPYVAAEHLARYRRQHDAWHRKGTARLAEGWCEDLVGRRAAARAVYREVLESHGDDEWLGREARRALARAYDERRRRDLDIDLFILRPTEV